MPKLFEQSTAVIGRPTSAAQADDRFPDDMATGTPAALRADMVELLGADQVLTRVSDLVRYASDGSPYRLLPQVVLVPRTVADVAKVLKYCSTNGRHATFRAGGTSLCGQSQGDDLIIDTREHWAGMVVEGGTLRARPGTILAHANTVLARQGRRLGPDPASARAACIGGVLANNAAGMRCTIERSAYNTLRHVTFVLPSGTVINTADVDAAERFERLEPELAAGLLQIRDEILADPELAERIRAKYEIRNTTGYTMKAFLDADTALGIFQKLLVGSEGTLAFIAEAVIDTLPVPNVIGICWIHTPSVTDAVSIVPRIKALGAEAVEMLLASSLTNYSKKLVAPPAEWVQLADDGASLLVEFGADSADELDRIADQVKAVVADDNVLFPVEMTTDAEFIALSWLVRSQMNSDLALSRPVGAANVNEDVCFPPARLGEAVLELQDMLTRYGYPPSVAGHAAYGNMHFTLTPRLDDPAERDRYGAFMEEFAEMVIDKYDGSLKAEHGTGINMAPFVQREWGPKATELMWRLRNLADPHRVLGRDVVLSEDAGVHLKRFRSEPTVEDEINRCIECGFCEPACPSRHVTATPRQRIVLRREMARQPAGSPVLKELLADYQYDAIETCAVDSSCAADCPYGIDTGAVMKQFRGKQAGAGRERVALAVARRWGSVERVARLLMMVVSGLQRPLGYRPFRLMTEALRTVISPDLMPTVPGPMPQGAKAKLPVTQPVGAAAVYFPACVNRIFGRDPGVGGDEPSLPKALVEVSARAGRRLWIPPDVGGHCCGTIWSSKGYARGRDYMYRKMAESLLAWTNEGDLPVVVDATSCTHGLLREVPKKLPDDLRLRFEKLRIIDSLEWGRQLLDDLNVTRQQGTVVVHPGCSANRLALDRTALALAGALASEVHVPYGAGCCGTAGDRGLLHPELVVSATKDERKDLPEQAQAYVSSNRTCEMGLRQVTGQPFESVIFLLEKATRGAREAADR